MKRTFLPKKKKVQLNALSRDHGNMKCVRIDLSLHVVFCQLAKGAVRAGQQERHYKLITAERSPSTPPGCT